MQCFIGTFNPVDTDTSNVKDLIENNVLGTITVPDTIDCENLCFSSLTRADGGNTVQFGCWDAYSSTGIQYGGDQVCI